MPAPAQFGFLLLITITTAASAQQGSTRIAGPGPSPVLGVAARGPLQQSFVLDSVRRDIRPTRWKEGALIGGLVTGLGLALVMDGLCDTGDCGGALTGGFLAGGLLGGLVGALIGGQFPKAHDP